MSPTFTDNDGRFHWGKIAYHARSGFAVLLSATVLLGGGWVVYNVAHDAYIEWRTTEDFIGDGVGEVEVLIEQGMGATDIGDLLTEAGVVRSTRAFRDAVDDAAAQSSLKAGRYKLKKQLPAAKALEMLLDPANQILLKVVFTEGTTMTQQAEIITSDIGISADDVTAAADAKLYRNLPEYAGGQLEGVLFPSTYQVAEPPRAQAIRQTQIDTFVQLTNGISFEARATEMGRSPRDVLIVASILEREVSNNEQLPLVASVIYNRLAAGMKLEMDSTVHYALGKFDTVTTSPEDRKVDSPYNTYLYPGLPAGPIGNPGKAALEAALEPAKTNYKFFVTVNLDTGDTRFADTEEQHNENKKLYQAYCETSNRC